MAISDGKAAEDHAMIFRPSRVIRAIKSEHLNTLPLLLVGASQTLGQGVVVSIYVKEDGFEILIGQGYVQMVQDDGKIQVKIIKIPDGYELIWRNLIDNKPDTLSNTLVRPGQQFEGFV